MSLERVVLEFSGPGEVRTVEETLSAPGIGEVLLETECSAVSAGTELLIYRGQAPEGIPLDETLDSLAGSISYPLRYGYALVGRVTGVGPETDESLLGKRVFAFHPHASAAVVSASAVRPIPEDVPAERAAFLPNLETAVNLLLDGAPLFGESVAVFGLGVVGVLTSLLLTRMLRTGVVAFEPQEYRRSLALSLSPGTHCADPAELPRYIEAPRTENSCYHALHTHYPGFDLVYELTGRPETANQAIEATGFAGRIVLGSWYGRKRAPLDLGGRFHRGRIDVRSSQVSTIRPELSGRWTTNRRLETALSLLSELPLERLVSQEVSIFDATEAYQRLDAGEQGLLQLLFRY